MFELDALVGKVTDTAMRRTMKQLRKRRDRFATDLEMQLMAVAMTPGARQALEAEFAKQWDKAVELPGEVDEVVVGCGVHGTTYANVRAAMGYNRVLVLDRRVPGGPFAGEPWFDLNSRNRGGGTGLPSENRALNYLPASPVQMAMLSSREFQHNGDLAFALCCGAWANTLPRKAEVTGIYTNNALSSRQLRVMTADGRTVYTDRVIDARGLGGTSTPATPDGEVLLDYFQWSERMSQPFPLEGLRRIAVVGNGNSAKVACESLLGIGPRAGMSVPGLDWVEQVDLYGPNLPTTCEEWRTRERGRYQELGSFLKPLDNGVPRLRVFNERGFPSRGFEAALVNGRTYDAVVMMTGWQSQSIEGDYFYDDDGEEDEFTIGYAPEVARQLGTREVYRVGPIARLEVDTFESELTAFSLETDNSDAIWRLAPRTAALASRLPGVPRSAPVEAITPRPRRGAIVGKDFVGRDIRLGDRVSFREEFNTERVTGTVVKSRSNSGASFCVQRDDGQKGGGPNSSWYISAEGLLTVELLA